MLRFCFLALLAAFSGCAAQSPDSMAPSSATVCEEPRPQVCTMEYLPVCGNLSAGGMKTYSNACSACSDAAVAAWVEGECAQ